MSERNACHMPVFPAPVRSALAAGPRMTTPCTRFRTPRPRPRARRARTARHGTALADSQYRRHRAPTRDNRSRRGVQAPTSGGAAQCSPRPQYYSYIVTSEIQICAEPVSVQPTEHRMTFYVCTQNLHQLLVNAVLACGTPRDGPAREATANHATPQPGGEHASRCSETPTCEAASRIVAGR